MPRDDQWVVDASVLVDLVLDGPSSQSSRRALSGRQLHAPAHVDVEVMSALARLHRASVITAPVARKALGAFERAPLTRHDVSTLLDDAWRRSARLRVADAFYVSLASRLDTKVLTIDVRLTRATTYAVRPETVGGTRR